MNEFAIEHRARNIHIVRVEVPTTRTGDVIFSALLRSDAHTDAPDSDRKMEMRHLELAKEQGAVILDNGDCFDVVQSRNDPRRRSGGKLPKHEVPNYIDQVVEDACDQYEPYADRWVMFGRGNHEDAILKQLGTDLTDRVATELRRRTGSNVTSGGDSGWVKFIFTVCGTGKYSILLHYYHGHGGGAPVTQGVIHSQRNSRKLPDADVVWTGHVHSEWVMSWARWRVNKFCSLYKDTQLHICTPGYLDAAADGYNSYAVRIGNEPRPIGAAWLDFIWAGRQGESEHREVWTDRRIAR